MMEQSKKCTKKFTNCIEDHERKGSPIFIICPERGYEV